jgi:hypothetical protein
VPGKDVVVPDLLELDLKAAPPSVMTRFELFVFWYLCSTFGSVLLTFVIFHRPSHHP